jgi:hypothetical protein
VLLSKKRSAGSLYTEPAQAKFRLYCQLVPPSAAPFGAAGLTVIDPRVERAG